jgi:peptidoglycan/xylan/chitin deacetylase (PgdA/CDA1 family)
LDELYGIYNNQIPAPAKPVVLTFDDGYIDFYTTAYPILAKYNFKAVSFIPAGLIGTGYYMNWDQIKEIQKSGLVTFEGHTVTHPNLTAISPAEALKELKEGKEILQSQTGYPVNFIAYPVGISNPSVHELAKQAGYTGGVGTWIGKTSGPGINMPRIRINGQMSLDTFIKNVQ